MGQLAPVEQKDVFPSGDRSETGLSTAEAEQRVVQFGPNEPVPAKIGGPLFQFLRFCTNPLVLILLVATAISAFLGQAVDAIIIAAMVVMSVVLNFVQAYRSERAVQGLRDQVAPRRPSSVTESGSNCRAGRSYRATSCDCRPAIWFLPMLAWCEARTFMFNRRR